MNDALDIAINTSKEIARELNSNVKIQVMSKELESGVGKTLDKIANYIIKSLPIPDCAKDILKDVKDALKTKDIKNVISTAVKSSIREGLELIGIKKDSVNDVFKLKDIAVKGGLSYNIKNCIDLVAKNFLKNNLTDEHLSTFFYELEKYIQSNEFVKKLDQMLSKSLKKKEIFLNQVSQWYKCYEKMEVEKMSNIAGKLKRKKELMIQYPECEKENGIIQNITAMLGNKPQKLSEIQLQLCSTL